jgi:hypothetical protein
MPAFIIDERNHIVALATAEQAAAASPPGETFTSPEELTALAATWPPSMRAATSLVRAI